jgi:hypothetical protein
MAGQPELPLELAVQQVTPVGEGVECGVTYQTCGGHCSCGKAV